MIEACELYLKRHLGTGVFLWILQNVSGHLFYKTLPMAASVDYQLRLYNVHFDYRLILTNVINWWIFLNCGRELKLRSNNRIFEGHKNFECYESEKIQESNFAVSNLKLKYQVSLPFFSCNASVFIIFHSTFDYQYH